MGVSKSYLAEITNESNQARGFAILGLNRALGLICGPIIGGFLASPSKKYPIYFPPNSFFDTYPYALPCILSFFLSITSTIGAYFVLEESLMRKIENDPEQTGLLSETLEIERKPLYMIIKTKPVYSSILMYMIIQIYYIVFDESFVLWARLSQQMGGIGWESNQLGAAFSFGGAILVFYQIFCYHRIAELIGPLNSFKVGVIATIPAFVILPRTAYLLPENLDGKELNEKTWPIWTLVFLCYALRSISSLQAYTSSFILIANSCPSQYRGSVNGIAQSLGSFSQLIGPLIGGYIFTTSVENRESLGPTFIFNLLILCSLFAFSVSMFAPKSLTRRAE